MAPAVAAKTTTKMVMLAVPFSVIRSWMREKESEVVGNAWGFK